MKWNSLNYDPSREYTNDLWTDKLFLLGTNGKKVGIVFYDFGEEAWGVIDKDMPTITHWMYAQEVFSPNQMIQVTKILRNPCCHKEF